MVFRWKYAKFSLSAEFSVLINFLPQSPYYSKCENSEKKMPFYSKSHKNAVIRVLWHAKFISALKTELNPTIFEKNAKNKIKYLITIIFLFFVIFSKSYLQNCIKTMKLWFFRWKDAKFGRNGIDPFFLPIASTSSY